MMKVLIAALLLLPLAQAAPLAPALEEGAYRNYQKQFAELDAFPVMPKAPEDQKLALDAIEDALEYGGKRAKLKNWFTPAQETELTSHERVRWLRLKARYTALSEFGESLALQIARTQLDARMKQELQLLRSLLRSNVAKKEIANLIPDAKKRDFTAPSAAELKALFTETPDLASFQGGAYAKAPRIFVFCRHDHNQPCLLAMRDRNNEPVRENGQLWLQPALGLSNRGLPYNQRNGNTPQGAQLVDGVMPVADIPFSYGKYRRLILNFVPASSGEAEQQKLFPAKVKDAAWWREAVEARDIGRNLLRIHGVGEINKEPQKPYYPFIPTIGCLAQREGKYPEAEYSDQRKLLDRWMRAMGLEAKFENEPSIKGVMYFVEISNESRAVTRADLSQLGIR